MPLEYMTPALGRVERGRDKQWLTSPDIFASRMSNGRWKRAKHLTLIANELAQIEHHPIFLIVNMPPRHGKSELISHWTPVWYLKRWPMNRIIIASYESGLATEWGGAVKNSIEENYDDLNLMLTRDTKAKANWKIKGYGGGMYAAGVGGAITGRGGDLLLIDDPIKGAAEANSPTYREALWTWYRATFRTRLQPGGSIVILMTRWHEDDLVGRLLSPEYRSENPAIADKWKVINLPATATSQDELGRDVGDALWPEMYDLDSLATLRESVGPYWYDAEYQGNPRHQGGSIFKEGWFNYITPEEVSKERFTRVIQFWDTAFKQDQRASRSACVTIGETKTRYIILHVWYGHPEFGALQRTAEELAERFGVDRVLIEDKASGISLIQQLRRDTKIPIKAIPAKDDKETRAHSVSGIVEAGKVWLKSGEDWNSEFISEVCSFPTGVHNDIVDSFVHGLRYLKPHRSVLGQSNLRTQKKESIWKV